MATQLHTTTADELLAIPEDGIRRELVAGELREMTPGGFEHGFIVDNVATPLSMHVRAHGLGRVSSSETGFRLASDPDTVRCPDVGFVRGERLEQTGRTKGFFPGSPDLAIEVISPTDRYSDVLIKVRDYLDAGTSMVIVVEPATRQVAVHRPRRETTELTENDVLDGGDVVPGWTLPVRDIFA